MSDFTSAIPVQAPFATEATSPPSTARLRVRLDRVRAEMAELGLDERTVAFWGRLSPRLVHDVLTTGTASRATLRRLRSSLRWAWTDRVGPGLDVAHWKRVDMKYLSDDVK
jgi:hypothetical protein